MMQMVEKIARALCAPFDPDETVFLGGYVKRWESHADQAKLALHAMLEPSDRMLEAYWSQTGESEAMRTRTYAYMKRYFSAMIEAELEDGDMSAFIRDLDPDDFDADAKDPGDDM